VLNDSDLAFEQDDEVIRLIAVAEEHVANRDALLRPLAVENFELRFAQLRPITRELRGSLRAGRRMSHLGLRGTAGRKARGVTTMGARGRGRWRWSGQARRGAAMS
jgi:hypothetical protein